MKLNNFKDYSIFFWLILITILGVSITSIYKKNLQEQSLLIKESLENIYLKKLVKEITENLEPRYTSTEYTSKAGDTYESIVRKLNIKKSEKKIILDTILKEKSLKILRINQRFIFKLDNLADQKIVEFKIETDKKNEVLFKKSASSNIFVTKKIKKKFHQKVSL